MNKKLQATISLETFKELRKQAIDHNVTLGEYITQFVENNKKE